MVTEEAIREALKEVYDPEIPFNIVDLGLIYNIDIREGGQVNILMTLTTPWCPVGPFLAEQVREVVKLVPGVEEVEVEITFDPPWDPSMMSEEAKEGLGM